MSYSRMSWRDYNVTLSYPSGAVRHTSVRAVSYRDADWRASARWGLRGVEVRVVGETLNDPNPDPDVGKCITVGCSTWTEQTQCGPCREQRAIRRANRLAGS